MRLRIIFISLLCLVLLSEASAQVQWGLKAGGNLSAMLLKDEGGYTRVKLRPGFHLGGTTDIKLSEPFFLQPALLLTSKGFSLDKDGGALVLYDVDKIRFTSYYVELPVNLLFKLNMEKNRIFFGAGPYIAYGLGGGWKAEANGLSVKGKLKFLNNYSSMDSSFGGNTRTVPYTRPFDFGVNILAGYELSNNLYFHLNGQLGLLDVDMSYNGVSDERSSVKTVQGGISIGYRF